MTDAQAAPLCAELRARLLNTVSETGGHLASNLGAVELTVALHRVFDLERDRLVFDVGHQGYIHKMLTGRAEQMHTLRTFGGLSGFPKPAESVADAFVAGHASTAVSVALGLARARTLQKKNHHVIALLGDGALTGGLAYEGLSDTGQSGERLLIILNDNGMSITKNVGAVATRLAHQRLKPQYLRFKKAYRKLMDVTGLGRSVYRMTHKVKKGIKEAMLPSSMFESMGLTYWGPVDGHDVGLLTRLLSYAKELDEGPVVLHVKTVKGKGFPPAEQNPDEFHGVGRFDIATGAPIAPPAENYSAFFGDALCALAAEDARICAVTAAMQTGTGLDGFARQFPSRFFDVGIAEGHAVTMAAGMAKGGAIPVFAVYSSFLQRAYDMLIHDVALQGLHVVLAVDRAGLVGEDGETHQGLFDAAFLSTVPGMTLYAPASFREFEDMLRHAVLRLRGPVALRYPRGGEGTWQGGWSGDDCTLLRPGGDLTMVTHGAMLGPVLEAAARLAERGVEAEVIKLNELASPDLTPVLASVQRTGRLLTAEDCVCRYSAGERIAAALLRGGIAPKAMALQSTGGGFVQQGTVAELRRLCGLDAASLVEKALEVCRHV